MFYLLVIDREAGEIIRLVASVRLSVNTLTLDINSDIYRCQSMVFVCVCKLLFRQVARWRSIMLLIKVSTLEAQPGILVLTCY